MLSLRNVYAGYNGGDVIHDISMEVERGQSLSIIGPNGCGKTTLLKVIASLLPSRGEIEIDGKPVRKMNSKELSLKVAMLGQITSVYFSYSVFETVLMGRYPHIKDSFLGLPATKDKEYAQHCIDVVGLSGERDKEITRLSGGQLQRVFLARALAQEPEILLLDEPTNHLDLKYQIEFIEYIKRWANEGCRAVIGVLHDINLAVRLGGDIMVMKNGRVEACGAAHETISDALLERVYEIDVAQFMRETLCIWGTTGMPGEYGGSD